MTFTDGLTASAIILAVVAIVSEIVFFIVQTDRAAKSQREISDYVGQMRQVLGKIEGLTTSTREQLQEQFRWLLEKAVGEERASIGQELEERVAGIEERVGGLAGGLSSEAEEQMDNLMGELKREVRRLAKDVEALRQPPPPQPAAPRGSETPFLDKFLQEAYDRWAPAGAVEPTEDKPET